jgi:hypothetical protein
LDVTFTRPVKAKNMTLSPELSLFNVFNANPILTQSTAYPAVGTPLTILNGRTLRFGVTVRY